MISKANNRTFVYIDGFNLYFGQLKGTPFKWLDIDSLFSDLLRHSNVLQVRYFTAQVINRDGDTGVRARQETYLRALRANPRISIHFGKFVMRPKKYPLWSDNSTRVKVLHTEEKGSDVNLASHLILDGCRGKYDTAVVVSNDSDLREPVRIVREELGLDVLAFNPSRPRLRHRTHKKATQDPPMLPANETRHIRRTWLENHQLPDRVHLKDGWVDKPSEW